MFADWCARLVNVDAPGSTSANVRSLGHTRCPRPIFPLDPSVPFHPKAKLFQRAALSPAGLIAPDENVLCLPRRTPPRDDRPCRLGPRPGCPLGRRPPAGGDLRFE